MVSHNTCHGNACDVKKDLYRCRNTDCRAPSRYCRVCLRTYNRCCGCDQRMFADMAIVPAVSNMSVSPIGLRWQQFCRADWPILITFNSMDGVTVFDYADSKEYCYKKNELKTTPFHISNIITKCNDSTSHLPLWIKGVSLALERVEQSIFGGSVSYVAQSPTKDAIVKRAKRIQSEVSTLNVKMVNGISRSLERVEQSVFGGSVSYVTQTPTKDDIINRVKRIRSEVSAPNGKMNQINGSILNERIVNSLYEYSEMNFDNADVLIANFSRYSNIIQQYSNTIQHLARKAKSSAVHPNKKRRITSGPSESFETLQNGLSKLYENTKNENSTLKELIESLRVQIATHTGRNESLEKELKERIESWEKGSKGIKESVHQILEHDESLRKTNDTLKKENNSLRRAFQTLKGKTTHYVPKLK